MKAKARIEAGVCGFITCAVATCDDEQNVIFEITSDCEKVRAFAAALANHGPVDAYQEISSATRSVVMTAARTALQGCCAACAAPIGTFKALQVAASLALPKDLHITLTNEK